MTSSPGPMPSALSVVSSALVPLAVARQCFAPVSAAYACSGETAMLAACNDLERSNRCSGLTLGKSQYIIAMPDGNQSRKIEQRPTPSQRCTKISARLSIGPS